MFTVSLKIPVQSDGLHRVQRNKIVFGVSKYCYWKLPCIFVSSIAFFFCYSTINRLKIRRESEREREMRQGNAVGCSTLIIVTGKGGISFCKYL